MSANPSVQSSRSTSIFPSPTSNSAPIEHARPTPPRPNRPEVTALLHHHPVIALHCTRNRSTRAKRRDRDAARRSSNILAGHLALARQDYEHSDGDGRAQTKGYATICHRTGAALRAVCWGAPYLAASPASKQAANHLTSPILLLAAIRAPTLAPVLCSGPP